MRIISNTISVIFISITLIACGGGASSSNEIIEEVQEDNNNNNNNNEVIKGEKIFNNNSFTYEWGNKQKVLKLLLKLNENNINNNIQINAYMNDKKNSNNDFIIGLNLNNKYMDNLLTLDNDNIIEKGILTREKISEKMIELVINVNNSTGVVNLNFTDKEGKEFINKNIQIPDYEEINLGFNKLEIKSLGNGSDNSNGYFYSINSEELENNNDINFNEKNEMVLLNTNNTIQVFNWDDDIMISKNFYKNEINNLWERNGFQDYYLIPKSNKEIDYIKDNGEEGTFIINNSIKIKSLLQHNYNDLYENNIKQIINKKSNIDLEKYWSVNKNLTYEYNNENILINSVEHLAKAFINEGLIFGEEKKLKIIDDNKVINLNNTVVGKWYINNGFIQIIIPNSFEEYNLKIIENSNNDFYIKEILIKKSGWNKIFKSYNGEDLNIMFNNTTDLNY